MSLATNVVRRGSTFYFRVAVPQRLRALVARVELWRSLRTSHPTTARRRAATLLLLTERLWSDLERLMEWEFEKVDWTSVERVDGAEVKALIDGWLKAELDEDAYRREAPEGELFAGVVLRSEPAWKPDAVVRRITYDDLAEANGLTDPFGSLDPGEYLRRDVSDLTLALEAQKKLFADAAERHKREEESVAEEHVKALFARYGIPVDEFSAKFEAATRLMLKAHRDLWGAVQKRDAVAWRPRLDDDPAQDLLAKLDVSRVVQPIHAGRPAEPISETFSWAEREYLAEVRRGGLSEGRVGEFEVAFRVFRQWLEGDPALKDITPAIAGDFRLALSRMPSSASTRPEYRDLCVRECIARAREIGEERFLSPTTIGGNYINPLRSLFEWARSTGKVAENPFANIRPPKVRTPVAKREREVFTSEQLNALFRQPLFTGAKGERGKPLYQAGEMRIADWRFWVPLIALFSGARLNEICGLRVADFECEGDVRFFHVRADAPDKSVKTEAGVRRVPIHASLVELGLLDHVERLRAEGAERVFPNLRPGARGYLSDIPSKFFADLIDRALGKEAPVVFHSFRHTFITRLRAARVEPLLRMAIVGHDPGETHENYGEQDIVALDAELQKVTYPGLDLRGARRPER